MIARELETECKRCNGTGRVPPAKGRIATVCSCTAARMLAQSHVFITARDPRTGAWAVVGG